MINAELLNILWYFTFQKYIFCVILTILLYFLSGIVIFCSFSFHTPMKNANYWIFFDITHSVMRYYKIFNCMNVVYRSSMCHWTDTELMNVCVIPSSITQGQSMEECEGLPYNLHSPIPVNIAQNIMNDIKRIKSKQVASVWLICCLVLV